jgi:hypothetical protein
MLVPVSLLSSMSLKFVFFLSGNMSKDVQVIIVQSADEEK